MACHSRRRTSELIAQIALRSCALLLAVVFTLVTALGAGHPPFELRHLAALPSLAAMAYAQGVLPVAVIGAPLYAALEARRRATAATAILVGIVPGLIILIVSAVKPS